MQLGERKWMYRCMTNTHAAHRHTSVYVCMQLREIIAQVYDEENA